ncbi:MAG TPA: hypothetical protein VNT81_06870 [Vicinamibacterales bacterium]|nr:hypothetical protein [Vicinamibacterales bacterium]
MTFMCNERECVTRLQKALGLPDPWLAGVLHHWGFDDTCADLLPWIPAISVAWIEGLTLAEHQRLVALIEQRHRSLSPRAKVLLTAWLSDPPPAYLVRVARRTLCEQLAGLHGAERDALHARVLGPCEDIARVSGGRFGFGAISAAEGVMLRELSRRLSTAHR